MATSSKTAKPAAKGAETAEAPKKSKKMLIIIIAVVLLVLILGGGAAAFFLMSGKAKAGGGEEHAAASSGEASKAPVFVPIEPYVVNLQQETGDQFLQTSITLQVADDATAEAIKTFMPLVRSRLLFVLSNKKASDLNTADGKKKLTAEIIASLNQPFATGGKVQQVNDVLYTSFVIQQQ